MIVYQFPCISSNLLKYIGVKMLFIDKWVTYSDKEKTCNKKSSISQYLLNLSSPLIMTAKIWSMLSIFDIIPLITIEISALHNSLVHCTNKKCASYIDKFVRNKQCSIWESIPLVKGEKQLIGLTESWVVTTCCL